MARSLALTGLFAKRLGDALAAVSFVGLTCEPAYPALGTIPV
jgi:hypothetical protein